MNHKVPPISQHGLVYESNWDTSVCGIASLYMVIRALDPHTNITADDILKKCLSLNGYIPNIGWKHKELAQTAEVFGFLGVSYDWFSESSEDAFEKLKKELKSGPVIASIYNKFMPGNGGHLIVVWGIYAGAILVNDPAETDSEKISKKIPLDTFLHGWKRRVIVVRER